MFFHVHALITAAAIRRAEKIRNRNRVIKMRLTSLLVEALNITRVSFGEFLISLLNEWRDDNKKKQNSFQNILQK